MAVSAVYAICTAYEAGIGKGLAGRPDRNPFPTDRSELSRQANEAWGYGFDKGRRDRERQLNHNQPQGSATP